jgi:hypothetical protein
MEIYLNGELVELQLENEKTLGDFLIGFEKLSEEFEATIIKIIVDGKIITADKIDENSKILLDTINKLELETLKKSDILEAYNDLISKCESLFERLENVGVQLQNNSDSEASKTVAEFANFFDGFCRIMTLSTLFDFYKKLDFDGMNPNEFLADFSPILSDLKNAIEDKDTVLIGDLCEYEILPRLQIIQKTLEQVQN